MRTLCISVGNPLRGDDGVAHRVLDLLESTLPATFLRAQQLTPEMAEEVAKVQNVIIIDADVNPGVPRLEPVTFEVPRTRPLTHSTSPSDVVALAIHLFGFNGTALLCHVPGFHFNPGHGLSDEAEANAHRAREMILAAESVA